VNLSVMIVVVIYVGLLLIELMFTGTGCGGLTRGLAP
jgi:hypothetical protein